MVENFGPAFAALLREILRLIASRRSFFNSSRGLGTSTGFLVVMSNWNRDGFWIWAFDCFISLPGDSFDSVTVNDAVVDDVVDWIDCFNDLVLESRPDDDKVVIVFSAESIFGMGSV